MCCEFQDWVTALKLPTEIPQAPAHPWLPPLIPPPHPHPHRQSAGRREIIHTASQFEAGVLCQAERFAACLLSPAIEVIHRTIMLQVIVQKNTAACCTSTSNPLCPIIAESYIQKANTNPTESAQDGESRGHKILLPRKNYLQHNDFTSVELGNVLRIFE